MKKTILLLFLFGMFFFQSCTVHDTYTTVVNEVSDNPVLEITTSFSASNNFSRLVTITPPINNADLVLVYQLYEVYQGNDVWRLMPQKYFFGDSGQGELVYNYDFTLYDVNIFMEANFDMNTLSPVWTDNQTFRIVILPGYFSGKPSKAVDFYNYGATLKAYGINPNNIKKIKV